MPSAWPLAQVWTDLSDHVISTITNSALLLLPVALSFSFGLVALGKKLLGIRRR